MAMFHYYVYDTKCCVHRFCETRLSTKADVSLSDERQSHISETVAQISTDIVIVGS